MCGIGPFAIPLAMKGCTVLANDLNPQSFKYLTDNMKLNKIGSNLTAYNLCGRDFIRTCIQNGRTFDHVLMNLPASALEFLGMSLSLLSSLLIFKFLILDVFSEPSFAAGWTGELPMIHCYCFSSSETPEDDVHSVSNKLSLSLYFFYIKISRSVLKLSSGCPFQIIQFFMFAM